MENKLPRIERGITKLIVPHGKGEASFDALSERHGDYRIIGKRLLERNLKVPTGDCSASLIHAAHCYPETENEPEFKEIRHPPRENRWLLVFNRNLWTSKGVYVVPDLNAVGTSQPLNQEELEKMLKDGKELNWGGVRVSKDGRVRFAPKESYKFKGHTSESLVNDGFVIANYTSRGAEKLGEVSSKLADLPEILGLNIQEGEEPAQRVSALNNTRSRLDIFGIFYDNREYRGGYAFGVLENAEDATLKK